MIEFEIFLLDLLNGIQAACDFLRSAPPVFNNLIDIIIRIGHLHGILDNCLRQAQNGGQFQRHWSVQELLHEAIGRTQTRCIKFHTSILPPAVSIP